MVSVGAMSDAFVRSENMICVACEDSRAPRDNGKTEVVGILCRFSSLYLAFF